MTTYQQAICDELNAEFDAAASATPTLAVAATPVKAPATHVLHVVVALPPDACLMKQIVPPELQQDDKQRYIKSLEYRLMIDLESKGDHHKRLMLLLSKL